MKTLIILFLTLILCLPDVLCSQNDTKTIYIRPAAGYGFMRISNGDLDRISYWNEGSQWGALLLADIRLSEEESVFATIGAGTDNFYSSFNTKLVATDSVTRFSQAIQIHATSIYGGASYRLYEKGDVAGVSGTLALQGVIPHSAQSSLRPNPITGVDTDFESVEPEKFALYLLGSFQIELYPAEAFFFSIGITVNTAMTKLFTTYNSFNTTTNSTMLHAGIGVCF